LLKVKVLTNGKNIYESTKTIGFVIFLGRKSPFLAEKTTQKGNNLG
jgi:hypothetical protein